MGESDGVAIARLQEQIQGVREDVAAIVDEQRRTRTRLHNLEGMAQAYADTQKVTRRREEAQYRRLELRLQVLTVVIGVAAIIAPVLTVVALGK